MNRRDFSLTALAAGAALGPLLAASARAQSGAAVEGRDFVRLSQPAPVSAPAGKIEVVEFFSYSCPHCYHLEPLLEEWVKKLSADVAFRRVPVGFSAGHEAQQRLFYGLEAMGKLEAMHKRIFSAVQSHQQRLEKEAEQVAFLNANGVDGAQYAKVSKEFFAATKAMQAKKLAEAYKIDGTPAIGIQGRYWTAASLAGSHQRSLEVASELIQRVRKGG